MAHRDIPRPTLELLSLIRPFKAHIKAPLRPIGEKRAQLRRPSSLSEVENIANQKFP